MLISSIGRDYRHSKLQHHSKLIYGYKYLEVYRLTLACEYEGTLHLRTRVRVYRVYSIYRQGNQRPWLLPGFPDFSEIFTQQPEPVGRRLFGFPIRRRRKIFGV
jgi:hypothetical protein